MFMKIIRKIKTNNLEQNYLFLLKCFSILLMNKNNDLLVGVLNLKSPLFELCINMLTCLKK